MRIMTWERQSWRGKDNGIMETVLWGKLKSTGVQSSSLLSLWKRGGGLVAGLRLPDSISEHEAGEMKQPK